MDKINEIADLLHQFGQRWLPDEDYFSEFESNKDFAKKHFEEQGELTMMAVIDGRPREAKPGGENIKMVAVLIVTEGEQKEVAVRKVAKEFVKEFPDHMPVMFTLMSEAWISREKHGAPSGLMPSENPNREEVIVVMSTSIDQRNSQSTLIIERDSAGKFSGWGEVMEVLYKPGANPRELVSYRAIDFYREYFDLREKK